MNNFKHIPIELQRDDFRFIKLPENQKFPPTTKGWTDDGNFNHEEIVEHLENGGNYGVICGKGGLVVWDIDVTTQELFEKLKSKFTEPNRKTFTVKSGKLHGLHFYYICDDLEEYTGKSTIELELDGEHVGELRILNAYVVGPNSTHPNGSIYETNGGTIEHVSINYLLDYVKPLMKPEVEMVSDTTDIIESRNTLLSNIRLDNIAMPGKAEKVGNEIRGSHPIHGSDNGYNFHINISTNEWYCHRCKSGGDVALWLAVEAGIIECRDAKPGALQGKKFVEVLEYAKSKGLIEELPPAENDNIYKFCNMSYGKNGKLKITFSAEKTAKYLIDKYHLIFLNDKIWRYSDGLYVADGDIFIHKEIKEACGDLYNRYCQRETINTIEIMQYQDKDIFDPDPLVVGVANGVIDLRTGSFRKATTEDYITMQSPVKYNPNARCPNILKFLREVPESKRDVVSFVDMFAQMLMGRATRRFYTFTGVGGNGKQVLEKLAEAFIGKDLTTYLDLEDMDKSQFAAGDLFKKKLLIMTEKDETSTKSTRRLKAVSSGDGLRTDVKNRQSFGFSPICLPIIDSNNPPKFNDSSDGFMERQIVIRFNKSFVPKPIFVNDRVKDPNILEKLTTDEELSGLLNLALKRVGHIIRTGEPYQRLCKEEMHQQYSRASRPLISFFDDCCDVKKYGEHYEGAPKDKAIETGFAAPSHLYKYFEDYCRYVLNRAPLEYNDFVKFLKNDRDGCGLKPAVNPNRRYSINPATGNKEQQRGYEMVYFDYGAFKKLAPESELKG